MEGIKNNDLLKISTLEPILLNSSAAHAAQYLVSSMQMMRMQFEADWKKLRSQGVGPDERTRTLHGN